MYGSEPRVKCKNLHRPWQEVQLRVHWLREIDRPEFWKFLTEAVAGFQKFPAQRAEQRPEDIMPWKVLGQKWHLSPRDSRRVNGSTGKSRCWKSCASCCRKRPRGDSFCGTTSKWYTFARPVAASHGPRSIPNDRRASTCRWPGLRDALRRDGSRNWRAIRKCKPSARQGFGQTALVDASEIASADLAEFLREHYAAASEKMKRSLQKSMP